MLKISGRCRCANSAICRIPAAAIQVCRFPAMQADIGRLLLLYIFGGFCVDLKLFGLRPFLGRLTEYDLVVTEHFHMPTCRAALPAIE
jgi:hypothetical protein